MARQENVESAPEELEAFGTIGVPRKRFEALPVF